MKKMIKKLIIIVMLIAIPTIVFAGLAAFLPTPSTDKLLMETGDAILMETGDNILLE